MNEMKFYICKHCGNLVGMIQSAGVPMLCCGEKMEELKANSVDASAEKHVPVVTAENNVLHVAVGSAAHPMTQEHSIQWIYVQTERGGQRKNLKPGEEPAATFALCEDRAIAVYAYCNLHGLWKTAV